MAQACPPAPVIAPRLQALIDELRGVETQRGADAVSDRMWRLWTEAPDARAEELLATGMERLAIFDFDAAEAALGALIAYCPEFAEGYNQRAFARFLRGDYPGALVDLDRALALSPRHIAAMAGRALTLQGLGREAEAQIALRAALALNPWLPERAMLKPLPGDDI